MGETKKKMKMDDGKNKKMLKEVMYKFFQREKQRKILQHKISSCKLCPSLLEHGNNSAIVGYGSVLSNVMIVGQSLCTECVKTSIPFTKGSGFILDEIFFRAGLSRWDLFITYLVHCHPPKNRKSELVEILSCSPWLYEEIRIVKPTLIVTLGADAGRFFRGSFRAHDFSKTQLSDSEHNIFCSLFTLTHPAYFLHRSDEKRLEEYKERFSQILKEHAYFSLEQKGKLTWLKNAKNSLSSRKQ